MQKKSAMCPPFIHYNLGLPSYWGGREDDNPKVEIIMGFQSFGSHLGENTTQIDVVFATILRKVGNFFG